MSGSLFDYVRSGVEAITQTISQMIWRPAFDVKVIPFGIDADLTAGQRQKICIIEISRNSKEEQIEFPKPSSYQLERNGLPVTLNLDIDIKTTNGQRKMEIIVFAAYLTVSGSYLMMPQFPETSQIKFVNETSVQFLVKPSIPASLTVFKMIDPDSGNCLNLCQDKTTEIFVDVKDRYGNTVKDAKLDVKSSHVVLTSFRFDNESDYYVVTVDRNTQGAASLVLTSGPLRADVELGAMTRVAPSSRLSYSATWNSKRKSALCVLAGQVVKWRLSKQLNISDSSSEIKMKIGNKFGINEKINRRKEDMSLKFIKLPDNSDCFVEWQPLTAGKRSVTIYFNHGKENSKRRTLYVNVDPGSLFQVQSVGNPCICYPTDEQVVTFYGLDFYRNCNVHLNPMQWQLLESSGKNFQQKLILGSGTSKLEYHYRFDLPGRYLLELKSTDNALDLVEVPRPFSVEIASPLDAERCIVRMCNKPPIFDNCLKIAVFLPQVCTDVSDQHMKHVADFLEVKVDGESKPTEIDFHDSWAYIDIGNLQYGERKTCEVFYCEKMLGKTLQIDLEGICPLQISSFIEVFDLPTKIRCQGVPIGTLIGAEKANIHNINRVLALKSASTLLTLDKIVEDKQQNHAVAVNFDLNGFDDKSVDDIYKLLGLLVEGIHHYRKQAKRFGAKRRYWKEKESKAKRSEETDEEERHRENSTLCRDIKERYGDLMNECNEKASDATLRFYNLYRTDSEIDLHGQLVANEENLENLRKELRPNANMGFHDNDYIIQSIRDKNDEAIRHLHHRIKYFDHQKAQLEERDWLEIIVGAGHHSDNERQKIRPKVEEFLKRINFKYIECNPGSLLITFTEYSGKEPCLANFLCAKCHRSWESTTSWKGVYQMCYKCDKNDNISKCFPFKRRSLTSKSNYRRVETDVTRRDHRRLCQKCIELGSDCSGR